MAQGVKATLKITKKKINNCTAFWTLFLEHIEVYLLESHRILGSRVKFEFPWVLCLENQWHCQPAWKAMLIHAVILKLMVLLLVRCFTGDSKLYEGHELG